MSDIKTLTPPTQESCGCYQITAKGKNLIVWLPNADTARQIHDAMWACFVHGQRMGEKLRDAK